MYHVPALFLHPSRRLRTLALDIHADVLCIEPLRPQMLFYLHEVASAEQVECILGSWCMATRDPERPVSLAAQRSWDAHVSLTRADNEGGDDRKLLLDDAQLAALFGFVRRALLDPLALHAYLNPVQVSIDVVFPRTIRGRPVPTFSAAQTRRTDHEPMARAKGEAEEETETDRRARLRIGALGALQWILGTSALQLFVVRTSQVHVDIHSRGPGRKLADDVLDILSDSRVWSSLSHAQQCSFADVESFGHAQPGVRSYAWTLLQTLLDNWPGTPSPLHSPDVTNQAGYTDVIASLVPKLSVAILRSSFTEPSEQVRGTMWRPLLKSLKGTPCLSFVVSVTECPCTTDLPRAWEIDASFELYQTDESESDEEHGGSDAGEEPKIQPASAPVPKDRHSPGFANLLQFLELGCGGSPIQGYPAVVLVISSIPSSVRTFYSDLLLYDPETSPPQILLYSDSDIPASPFFSSFWAAIDGRAFSALDRTSKSAAFLVALLECLVFIVRRVRSAREEVDSVYHEDAEKVLVCEQYTRVWEACTSRRLRVEDGVAGELIAKSLSRLNAIDEGIHIHFISDQTLRRCSPCRSVRCSMGRSRTWDDGGP
jgi:E3 ubiquitin-protein ligase listerin